MSDNAVIESPAAQFSNINLSGVLRIPAVRQVILLLGVAASVAVGFAAVLWSQTPGYSTLERNVPTDVAVQMADALEIAGIRYKLDTDAGVVLVASNQLDAARMELATQGLAGSSGVGMDGLQEQSSFGQSQFMENAQYVKAQQEELAKTIASIGAVRSARVHLALPRQSSFVRDRGSTATASVFLELYRGRQLEPGQASAIVQLVASSTPNLPASNVALIDQFGRLLSSPGSQDDGAKIGNQMRVTQELEESYKRRIENLLSLRVGPGRVSAEVVAELDFTITEETRESFDPQQTVLRSEQINEEEMRDSSNLAQGVPGALSNQPPETGDAAGQAAAGDAGEAVNLSRSATRNFEVDRTISRVQPQPGRIQRLSVAILIDDSPEAGDDPETTGLTDEEVEGLIVIAKGAIGFNEDRGDTLDVSRGAFTELPEAPPLEEPAIWENPMVIDIAKLLLGATVALALGFGLVRPMFKGLLASNGGVAGYAAGAPGLLMASGAPQGGGGQFALGAPSFDDKVAAAKNITNHDPARVAQIVRKWVTDNG